MRNFVLTIFICGILIFSAASLQADDFDTDLHEKALEYQQWIDQWHRPGLGALLSIEFTDDTLSEMECGHYQGDSTIWTGMYMGAQALRYKVLGTQAARDEIIDTAQYLHNLMEITQTPGYIGRFAGPRTPEFDCDIPDGHSWKVMGQDEWDGYYWICQTSRDQYSGWWWGLGWAYDVVDDEQMRQTIRDDFRAAMQMLLDNDWNITDQNGEYTGNGAAKVMGVLRLAWILLAAHVTEDPAYWDLLDEQYALIKPILWFDVWSFYNRYEEYFGNNLRHLAFQTIFRLWPDRERFEELWNVWQSANRPWVKNTYNPWFDAVHVTGCRRLGVCDQAEVDDIVADYELIMGQYWDPPSYKRGIQCSTQPLDPFSVWMDNFLAQVPWLESIIDIDPQTLDARELTDRHWTDIYWQSGGVFEASCNTTGDPTFVGPGMDYLLAYYLGIYHDLLPGNGPFDDPSFEDELDDDDDVSDDDAADDDSADDDDDDDNDDENDDDDSGDETGKTANEDDEEACCG